MIYFSYFLNYLISLIFLNVGAPRPGEPAAAGPGPAIYFLFYLIYFIYSIYLMLGSRAARAEVHLFFIVGQPPPLETTQG